MIRESYVTRLRYTAKPAADRIKKEEWGRDAPGGAGAGRVFKLPESAPFGTDRGGDEKGSSTLLRHSVHQHNFSLKSSLTILYQRNLKLN